MMIEPKLFLENLNIDNPTSIIQNYVVTEKADGLRCLLFIDDTTKYSYLINFMILLFKYL